MNNRFSVLGMKERCVFFYRVRAFTKAALQKSHHKHYQLQTHSECLFVMTCVIHHIDSASIGNSKNYKNSTFVRNAHAFAITLVTNTMTILPHCDWRILYTPAKQPITYVLWKRLKQYCWDISHLACPNAIINSQNDNT